MAAMMRKTPAAPSTENMPIMMPFAVEPMLLLYCDIRTASWCDVPCVNAVGCADGAMPLG
jgi:hypothetical protein